MASAPKEFAGTSGRHGVHSTVAHAIDELLRVATVSARNRIRAKDNFQPWSLHCVLNQFVVQRENFLHRR